ncbi:telomerase protein component 1 [Hemiscyllium ocellatum]|uniref:telomerase protein component 1 n=1 Tax=Hemiscyllium ocellatum TaxID=170820 RepID=UPI002965D743|nr:telomerase protein component 1 [Hemiscyllium ocellatum]
MKTERGGLRLPPGPGARRSPGLSARHLLTPRRGLGALRLPPGRLENRLLTAGPLTRLARPTLRYSGSLSPQLPLGIGPDGLTSPALAPEPQQPPEHQRTDTGTPQASEDPAEVAPPLPAYDLSGRNYEDLERAQVGLDAEGLCDVPDPSQDRDAALRRKKVELLNEVCCSLIQGANFSETDNPTRKRLQTLCQEIAQRDAEFILKAALYTRQELNIRTTANFLLALSAWIPSSRPHLRRYFCQAVRLPSDWIEVAWLYQSLASDSGHLAPFPSCLRQSLSDRFKGFDEYQLAKYNTRKQRCKSRQPRLGKSSPTPSDTDPKAGFSLKKLIRWLHLKDPCYPIMCLLGRRYPSDLQSFARSRLPGPWDSRRSGKRMKLQLPESWERELSLHGNRAEIWERLIDRQKLPYMAMLRNLRNVIAAGVSSGHHAQLLRRLADRDAVIRSRQFPFRFLAAYKALEGLQRRLDEKDEPLPTKAALVQQALETSMRPPRKLRELLGRARKARAGRQPAPRVAYAYRWATKRLADFRKSRYPLAGGDIWEGRRLMGRIQRVVGEALWGSWWILRTSSDPVTNLIPTPRDGPAHHVVRGCARARSGVPRRLPTPSFPDVRYFGAHVALPPPPPPALSLPALQETDTDTEGSEGTEQEADLHPDWEKLTMGDAYFDLAPWGRSKQGACDPSLWLTVVKESRARRPGGARSMLCADSQGSLWCSQWDPTVTLLEEPHVQDLSKWTHKQVHTDRVTAVTETPELIVTASYDRTVRLWDGEALKQVGLFSCRAPILCLEANPADPDLGACGDAGGDVYFLRWSSRPSPGRGEGDLLAQH